MIMHVALAFCGVEETHNQYVEIGPELTRNNIPLILNLSKAGDPSF